MYWQVHKLLHVKFTCVFGCEITLICKDFTLYTYDVENHKKYFKSSDFFAHFPLEITKIRPNKPSPTIIVKVPIKINA